MEFRALTPEQVTEHQTESRRQVAYDALRMAAIDAANVEQLTRVSARTDFPAEVRERAAAQVDEHRAKATRSSDVASKATQRSGMKAKDVRDVRGTVHSTLLAANERQYLASVAELEALRDDPDAGEALADAERAIALIEIQHDVLVAALA